MRDGWSRASSRGVVRPDCRLDRGGGDAEVRGAPDHAALVDQQRLRRFVANAESRRDRVGQLAVRLDGHDRVPCVELVFVQVIDQLVERLGARAARQAVLEEEQRPVSCLGQQPIEVFEMLRPGDVWMHPCAYARAAAWLALYWAILRATVRRPMSILPLKRAPSAMTTWSALRLPSTRAAAASSMRTLAVIEPRTVPCTTTRAP